MNSKAFTLIEMLVVIFILALLLGIVIPVLRKSREQAKSLHCRLNLKKIAEIMSMYEQNNGSFPQGFDIHEHIRPSGNYIGSGAHDSRGWWWFHFLHGLFIEHGHEKDKLLWCPSRKVRDPGGRLNVLCGNYGVNRSICKDNPTMPQLVDEEFKGTPLGLNRIKHPSQAMLVMDSGYTLVSWWAALENADTVYENKKREDHFYVPGLSINIKRNISHRCLDDANYGRHSNKRINIAFADMHVENKKSDDLLVQKMDDGYINLNPAWNPR